MRNRNKCILFGLAAYACFWAFFAVVANTGKEWYWTPIAFTLLIGAWVGFMNCITLIVDRRYSKDKW